MALLVCCPCGNPLDCERIDIVVTLECPKCRRELQIEMSDPHRGRFRAILTIMEGPFWVGEQFVLPIGQDLIVGKSGGTWLSLDGDEVAARHCRLKVTGRGAVQIEDLGSDSGTWIGELRIAKGKLRPADSFKVGEYRLRLDLQAAIGGEIVTQRVIDPDYSDILPDLKSVEGPRSIATQLISNRFKIIRQLIMGVAWLSAVCHLFRLHAAPHRWEWYMAILAAGAIFTPLLLAGRRVALVHRYLKFAAIALLIVLGIVDLAAWNLAIPATSAFVLAAAIPLLTLREPSAERVWTGVFLGATSLVLVGVDALRAFTDTAPL